jgi:5'/3'-nucleotidase SurE
VRILLTNDDGIYAPGLRALRAELRKLGEVVVVAPATEQSAAGHSVTLTTPLVVQEILDDERQRRFQRRHQRPLFRHGRRCYRGRVLSLYQHRLLAGIHQA